MAEAETDVRPSFVPEPDLVQKMRAEDVRAWFGPRMAPGPAVVPKLPVETKT